MAEASDIAATSSNYTGNAALGGGSFGFAELNVQPLLDLARYTMLYNKAEFDQKQKDAEAAADEIAAITSYDLTTGIKKDADVLQEKYDKLIEFIRGNSEATNYKNKAQWTEYRKMRNELENDIKAAKKRDLLYAMRQKEISDAPTEAEKKLLRERLEKEVDEKDIRTPLFHTNQYDVSLPEIPKGSAVQFDVYRKGPNQDYRRDHTLFDIRGARARGSAFALDLTSDNIDPNTEEGQNKIIARGKNFWVKGSEELNAAIQSSKDANGNLDETKMKGLSKQLVDLVKQTNKYLETKKAEIAAGTYTDQFGKPITFGGGMLHEEDYTPINYQDGISPDELAVVAQFATWQGDAYKTSTIQTNDQIEQARLAEERRQANLRNNQFYAGMSFKNNEDFLSADAVVREVADALENAEWRQFSQGGKVIKEVAAVSDPNILREFGTIDKDGTTTNVPDELHFDESKNQLSLVYYKRDAAVPGQYQKDKNGGFILDREVPVEPMQWMGQIVRRKNPNADIGGVNNVLNTIYEKYQRNLKNMSDNYKGGVKQKTGGTSGSARTSSGVKWQE